VLCPRRPLPPSRPTNTYPFARYQAMIRGSAAMVLPRKGLTRVSGSWLALASCISTIGCAWPPVAVAAATIESTDAWE
jgi:hypothetical protein